MPLYLFTHVFHFIEIGKKIRAHGHDFEEVMHAYDNWKNPMRDVTDLIGQLEALTGVKYSPRWYNILERNRRHTLDHYLFTCKGMRQLFVYPLVLFYLDWKKDTCVWARF